MAVIHSEVDQNQPKYDIRTNNVVAKDENQAGFGGYPDLNHQ